MELSVNEIAFIVSTFELKPALAGLLAFDEVASKLDLVIVPGFCTVAVLLVVLPVALIH